MTARKRLSLFAAGGLALMGGMIAPTSAHADAAADAPVTAAPVGTGATCTYHGSGGGRGETFTMYDVDVKELSSYSFRVTITDFTSPALIDPVTDEYVAFSGIERVAKNVVTIDPRLSVSDVRISQSVVSSQFSTDPPFVIGSYLDNAPSPFESVTLTPGSIEWLQDTGVYTDATGVQVTKDKYPAPEMQHDDAAGVLEFTVTARPDTQGEISLFSGMTSDFLLYSYQHGGLGEAEDIHRSIPGCNYTFEGLPGPGDPDPDPPVDPGPVDPDPDPPVDPGPVDPDPGPVDPDPGPVDPDPGPVDPGPGPVDPSPGPVTPDPGVQPGPGANPTQPGGATPAVAATPQRALAKTGGAVSPYLAGTISAALLAAGGLALLRRRGRADA